VAAWQDAPVRAPWIPARYSEGAQAGLPLAAAGLLLGVSFGVVAKPVMGSVAPIVMSAIVFAGSAQFAAVSVLSDGGSAAAAIVAGILLNARFIPMGVAIAPSLRTRPAVRVLVGQSLVDASWALASRGAGRFDVDVLVGATLVQYPAWVAGAAIGVFASDRIGDPGRFGLDAIFPAFFLGLLANELRSSRGAAAALIGAGVALALTPVAPPGVPVLAACAGALLGAWWR
jgi:4-azaleucine resistance transporter AzlC